jgi:hypothetical membrane protein
MKMNINSYSVLAGLVAPIFYLVLVSTLGLLEPDFSHRTDMMSMLGGVEGIRGLLFNIGVVITGLLLIVFAFGLHQSIHHGVGSKIGPILIALGGVGMFGSGIFSCDVNCVNVIESKTFIGILHMLNAFVAGSCLAISPFFIFFRMKQDKLWEKYRSFTLAIGVFANLPGVVLWVSMFTSRLPEWEGVIQRLGLLFPLIWIFVLAMRQLKSNMIEN